MREKNTPLVTASTRATRVRLVLGNCPSDKKITTYRLISFLIEELSFKEVFLPDEKYLADLVKLYR